MAPSTNKQAYVDSEGSFTSSDESSDTNMNELDAVFKTASTHTQDPEIMSSEEEDNGPNGDTDTGMLGSFWKNKILNPESNREIHELPEEISSVPEAVHNVSLTNKAFLASGTNTPSNQKVSFADLLNNLSTGIGQGPDDPASTANQPKPSQVFIEGLKSNINKIFSAVSKKTLKTGNYAQQPDEESLSADINPLASMASISLPAHQHEIKKVQRLAAYKDLKVEISGWDAVIKKNHAAASLEFPLNHEPIEKQTVQSISSRLKPETEMEKQIQEILDQSKSILEDNKGVFDEDIDIEAGLDDSDSDSAGSSGKRKPSQMTPEQRKIFEREQRARAEKIRKMRILLSQHELKRRRIKQIKSKTYHKHMKAFDEKVNAKLREMMGDDELKRIEQLRIEERMFLKHRQNSKWAKRLLGRGKKISQAERSALNDQVNLHKKLREKIYGEEDIPNDDDSAASGDENNALRSGDEYSSDQDDVDVLRSIHASTKNNKPESQIADGPLKSLMSLKFMQAAQAQKANQVKHDLDELRELWDDQYDANNEKQKSATELGFDYTNLQGRRQFAPGQGAAAKKHASLSEEEEEEDSGDADSDLDHGFSRKKTPVLGKKTKNLFETIHFNSDSDSKGTHDLDSLAYFSKPRRTGITHQLGTLSPKDFNDNLPSLPIVDQTQPQAGSAPSFSGDKKSSEEGDGSSNSSDSSDSESDDESGDEANPWLQIVNGEEEVSQDASESHPGTSSSSEDKSATPVKPTSKRDCKKEIFTFNLEHAVNDTDVFGNNSSATHSTESDELLDASGPVLQEKTAHSATFSLLANSNKTQRDLVKRAFEIDNLINPEFDLLKKMVENEEEDGDPANSTASANLPGWGNWIGEGVTASKKRKHDADSEKGYREDASVKKNSAKRERKDRLLRHVIISETKDKKFKSHQVKHIPSTFENKEQFETVISMIPLGKDWNVPSVFESATKPKFNTKAGRTIEPLNWDEKAKEIKAKMEERRNKNLMAHRKKLY